MPKRKSFSKEIENFRLWHDREIIFDGSTKKLQLINGEVSLYRFDKVEDTKGNNGELGVLIVTNLRLIWTANKYKKINLSIGISCIQNIFTKVINSKLRGGEVQSLTILTKQPQNMTKYEFQFTILTNTELDLKDSSIHNVLKTSKLAYDNTKLYRNVKIRSLEVLGHKNKLVLLEREKIVKQVDGVWSLASDSGTLGSFIDRI